MLWFRLSSLMYINCYMKKHQCKLVTVSTISVMLVISRTWEKCLNIVFLKVLPHFITLYPFKKPICFLPFFPYLHVFSISTSASSASILQFISPFFFNAISLFLFHTFRALASHSTAGIYTYIDVVAAPATRKFLSDHLTFQGGDTSR